MAVIGAGLTGASWAGLFAAAGLEVRLYDVDGERLAGAVERAAAAAGFLAGSGLADMQTAERGVEPLTGTADLAAAVAGVTHVQECVREDLALKREVFAAHQTRPRPPDALVCTSSSGLSISDIQTAAARPERCLAAHPYNPPHLVPLVELAPGALTSPEAMERAAAFYAAVGKEPVMLTRDLPGYLANRLSAALWREAVDLVLRGVATVEDVDKAVSFGPGLRWAAMGPHLLYDLGGGEEGIRRPRASTWPGSRRACCATSRPGRRSRPRPARCWTPASPRRRARAPTTSWSRNATPCSSPTCARSASSASSSTPRWTAHPVSRRSRCRGSRPR